MARLTPSFASIAETADGLRVRSTGDRSCSRRVPLIAFGTDLGRGIIDYVYRRVRWRD